MTPAPAQGSACGFAVLLLLWGAALDAHAQAPGEAAGSNPSREPQTEIGAVPFVGGDSDHGVGGGVLGAIERRVPGLLPYRWRLEAGAAITFKAGRNGQWISSPYQDLYIDLEWLLSARLWLLFRLAYTRESFLKYSGIGNAAPEPSLARSPTGERDFFEWNWRHPSLSAGIRGLLWQQVLLEGRLFFQQSWFDIPDQSQLRADAQRGLVIGTTSHALLYGDMALLLDTRDDQVNPRGGQYHQLKLRLSPGGTRFTPYRYAQSNLTLRFYATPVPRYLTVAVRGVADLQFGDAPFYELARIEQTFAFGGPNAVRGVPGQRYYGKVKLLSTLEFRSDLLPFVAFDTPCVLGVAAFLDLGRLWAGYGKHRELDGSGGGGLKLGIGGGPRLQVGKVLVVRADVAWSPDAHPVSGYFLAGHSF